MFEPQITLVPEPDGEFSLLGETLVPNACFSAGKAVREVHTESSSARRWCRCASR